MAASVRESLSLPVLVLVLWLPTQLSSMKNTKSIRWVRYVCLRDTLGVRGLESRWPKRWGEVGYVYTTQLTSCLLRVPQPSSASGLVTSDCRVERDTASSLTQDPQLSPSRLLSPDTRSAERHRIDNDASPKSTTRMRNFAKANGLETEPEQSVEKGKGQACTVV